MTHVLIVEGDPSLAARLAEVLTNEQVTIVCNTEEAMRAISTDRINIGVASSAMFHDALATQDLRHIPWIILVETAREEIAIHRMWPKLNARFLYKDAEQIYFQLLPLRIRATATHERVMSTITDRFPALVAYWDADERCQFANAAYRAWFHRPYGELIGKSMKEVLGPLYELNEGYVRGVLRGEAQQFERTIHDPGGGPDRHSLAVYAPDIQNGVVRGFVVIVTDIDEQYRLRQTLLGRERLWKTLFEILPVGMTVVDHQGNVVEQNPAILSILGIDPEGLANGKHKARTYIDAQRQPLCAADFPSNKAIAEQRVIGPIEIGIVREDHSTVWTSVTAAPFPTGDNVVVVTRDITAEKTSAARFEAIVDASPIPYALNDEQGNITYLNRAFVATFGYTRADILTLDDWWPQAYPESSYREWVAREWDKRIEKSRRDNTPFDPMELSIRAKDGSQKLAMVGAVALGGSFANVHLVVLVDVTAQRKVERQLEENRRLAALGALAGGIAHDFNNLLTPIVVHAEVALSEVPEDSPLVSGLSEIRTAASRATTLIRQILAMSRPEDDSKTRVELQKLVDEVAQLVRASLPSNIAIATHIDPNPPSVFANATRIHRVILNLATNARDAMVDTGGTLIISVHRTEGNQVKLCVSDTGIGIEPELQERIFEPYFTTKRSSGGTGLGLSTVRSIVTTLGGTISLQSEPGKGTIVEVLLPCMPERRPLPHRTKPSPAMQVAPANDEPKHILVVDDEAMVARAAARMITRLGHRATVVHSPLEALDVFRNDPSFDAVLTDHTMPEKTGLELAKELNDIRKIHILLATGYAEPLTEDTLRQAKIKRVLSKPYGLNALNDALAEIGTTLR